MNAPDLYIPFMALWTYCMLVGIGLLARGGFRPEAVYNAVTSALVAWGLHTLVLRAMLWSLGAGAAAPALELAAYAGYPWVGACATLAATLLRNRVAYHVVWVYASFAAAVFLVRTMKRVILQVREKGASFVCVGWGGGNRCGCSCWPSMVRRVEFHAVAEESTASVIF